MELAEHKKIRDLKLIEAVKKHECLYNPKSQEYKLIDYKQHIWARIAKQIGLSTDETKKKWKYFRDHYRRRPRTTIFQGVVTHRQYQYADHLRFLDNILCNTKSIINITLPDEDAEVSTDLSTDNEYQYSPPRKQIKNDFDDLPDNELQKFFNDSWNDGEYDDDNDAEETNNGKFETLTTEESTNLIAHNVTAEEDKVILQEQVGEKNENCKDSNESQEAVTLNEKLIDEIKKYECIYNFESELYKDYQYRLHIWQKIGKRFGLTANEVRLKWKNFRDAYRKYKLRVLNEDGLIKPYKYAERLKFLDDTNALKPLLLKRAQNFLSDQEVSTDLSGCENDEDILQIPTLTKRLKNKNIKKSLPPQEFEEIPDLDSDDVNANNITTGLFKLLVNKIDEANLNVKERNDIEFAVSRAVYSKLAEYAKINNAE